MILFTHKKQQRNIKHRTSWMNSNSHEKKEKQHPMKTEIIWCFVVESGWIYENNSDFIIFHAVCICVYEKQVAILKIYYSNEQLKIRNGKNWNWNWNSIYNLQMRRPKNNFRVWNDLIVQFNVQFLIRFCGLIQINFAIIIT